MALVVKRILKGVGIGPTDLTRRFGYSKTSWCRMLNGEREIQGTRPRACIEQVLQEAGLQVGAELWAIDHPEDKHETNTPGGKPENGAPCPEPDTEIHMQGQTLSSLAQRNWGLFMSPFEPEAIIDPATGLDRLNELFLPPGHRFAEERLVQAFIKAGFVALAGEPGSGKSTLLERAFRRAAEMKQLAMVTPANVERRKLRAAHISAELIRQLSEESVPRMANTRDALAAQLLAQRYEKGQRVALVIDEAHELPHDTIKDLKRFHEFTDGFARLLAIILIGQTELRGRFDLERNYKLREAIIRCQLVVLRPMVGEVAGYLQTRFKWVGKSLDDVFEPDAVRAVEARLGVHEQQYPVIIGNVATAAMNIAAKRGETRVTEDDVEAVWAATPDQLQELGL